MTKKVSWPEGNYGSLGRANGAYSSFKEWFQKRDAQRQEQEKAIKFFQKASPILHKCLEMKLTKGHPIIVMRPLKYTSSDLSKSDGFYANEGGNNAKFVDEVKTLYPGTTLLFKAFDSGLGEMIFETGTGEEVCIHTDEKQGLLTQTDVYETVIGYLEKKE